MFLGRDNIRQVFHRFGEGSGKLSRVQFSAFFHEYVGGRKTTVSIESDDAPGRQCSDFRRCVFLADHLKADLETVRNKTCFWIDTSKLLPDFLHGGVRSHGDDNIEFFQQIVHHAIVAREIAAGDGASKPGIQLSQGLHKVHKRGQVPLRQLDDLRALDHCAQAG